MVKGWPIRSAAKARCATGATPIRQAATKAHLPISGARYSMTQAAPSSRAVKITSLPLAGLIPALAPVGGIVMDMTGAAVTAIVALCAAPAFGPWS